MLISVASIEDKLISMAELLMSFAHLLQIDLSCYPEMFFKQKNVYHKLKIYLKWNACMKLVWVSSP